MTNLSEYMRERVEAIVHEARLQPNEISCKKYTEDIMDLLEEVKEQEKLKYQSLPPFNPSNDSDWYILHWDNKEEYWVPMDIEEVDQKARNKPTTINRFEVINHLPDGQGREILVWEEDNFTVETSLQDDGRTLKIFLQSLTKESK